MFRLFAIYPLLVCLPLAAQSPVFPLFGPAARAAGGTGVTTAVGNPAGAAADEILAQAFVEQRFGLAELQIAGLRARPLAGVGVELARLQLPGYATTRLGGSYGRRLSERWRLGGELIGLHHRSEGFAGVWTLGLGLGAVWRATDAARVGLRLLRSADSQLLPHYLALGGSYRLSPFVGLRLEGHFANGASPRLHTGLTYAPHHSLRLHAGLVTGGSELSFGADYLLAGGWRLSFATAYHERLGVSPLFGIAYGRRKSSNTETAPAVR